MALHTIYLDTVLVVAEVRKRFPVERVSLDLDNDLAVGKVLVRPEITAIPLPEHLDDLGIRYSGVFPVLKKGGTKI